MAETPSCRQVIAACVMWAAGAAHAVTAVPYYTPAHFVEGLYAHWYVPRSAELAQRSGAMQQAVQQWCEAAPPAERAARVAARTAWQSAAQAWDRLSAVAVGPLVQRRSARQIDFHPTRPRLIERGIAAAPADAKDMERVGTPGKGFPALEWLLWREQVTARTPACRYAVQVAAEIDREAVALRDAFAGAVQRGWEDEQASQAMGEAVNQWVGAVERLRWADIGRPAASAHGNAPEFPRAASGGSGAAWTARWAGIEALTVQGAGAPPAPGAGLVPVETYLRGRGLNPLADRLRASVQAVQAPLGALAQSAAAAQVPAVTAALGEFKRVAEGDVAAALNVNIGFSDADGD